MDHSETKKISAPALSRGLRVMEMIAKSSHAPNLTDVARELDIAMSSAHSICSTLLHEGYISKDCDGTFSLTNRILELASSKIAKYEIAEHFYEACENHQLIRENGATLTVLQGGDVLFLAALNNPQPLGVTFRPGTRMPACCLASGRALLASLSDAEVCELYPDENLPQITSVGNVFPKHRSELLEILQEARQNGYAHQIRGTWPQLCSFGVLVTSTDRKAKAAVSIVLADSDLNPDTEAAAIATIQKLAAELSQFGDWLTN